MKKILTIAALLTTGFSLPLLGCYMKTEHKIEAHITIDIRELSNTANQIEDMVRSKKAKGGQSLFKSILPWSVAPAYGDMQIKFMTPAVEQAIANRGARWDALEELMRQGCLGENNRGYVEYRPCPNCQRDTSLKEKAEKQAREENQDRLTIYKAIMEQNNLSNDQLSLVEKVFSQSQREKAPASSFIQQDDGRWIKK